MSDSLIAVLPITTGVGLLILGADVSLVRQYRSARWFDLVTGGFLVVLGAVTILRTLQEGAGFYFISFVLFLTGLLLFRNYYVLRPTSQLRSRDQFNSALGAIPGLSGMITLVTDSGILFLVSLLLALLIVLVSFVSLIYDIVRYARGERVFQRDLVVGAGLMLLGYLYIAVPLADFTPPA